MSRYHDSCCARIKQINNAIEKYVNNLMREIDITMMQSSVLVETDMADGKERSLKWLERKFNVAQPTMLGIVKRLEQKGLVETHSCPEDERMKMVHATEAGSEKSRCGYAYMDHTEEILLRSLTSEEQNEFRRLLRKIKESLS